MQSFGDAQADGGDRLIPSVDRARGHDALEKLETLDQETSTLVRVAAQLAGGSEQQVRLALAGAIGVVRPAWIEELVLQTYLFAGFPRALNAAREWRRLSGLVPDPSSASDADAWESGGSEDDAAQWLQNGLRTCAIVYGPFYEKLRVNIRALHPALDRWMIIEGYGKVLSRPGLDLCRRELCIIAACAIGGHDRQLHSHLHGALHAGASPAVIDAVLTTLAPLITDDQIARYRGLWTRVQGK